MIFESPDKGKTIYAREAGETKRTLYSIDGDITDMFISIREDKLWGEIRRSAKTNNALQAALDHAIMIYKLSKDYE